MIRGRPRTLGAVFKAVHSVTKFCKYSEDELKMNCVVKVFRGKANVLTSAEIFSIIFFFLFLRIRQKQTVIKKKKKKLLSVHS